MQAGIRVKVALPLSSTKMTVRSTGQYTTCINKNMIAMHYGVNGKTEWKINR